LFEAVAHLLNIAAEKGGVVVILDDLHWADKGSLMLLRHLLRSADPIALLVVGTYRDTDLSRTHPLAEMLADFRRNDDVERLTLSGLDLAGVEAFVEAAAGQSLGADGMSLARAVHDETEGNPFFVGQVLRHLAESGAIFERDGQWSFEGDVAHLGIPEGVREVIGHRLNRLDDEVNRVLRTAAVIGREFDLRLVAEVGELSEDDVVDALEAAASVRLVAEVPSKADHFMYAHALVRESLYEELSTSRRTRLHKRIGEALERRPDPPLAALAHHFCESAAMGDVEKAADYACQAGDEARAALAQEDAAVHYIRGVEVLDEAGVSTDRIRIGLLTGLADAYNSMGRLDEAVGLAADAALMARALDDSELFARAAVASAVGAPPVPNDLSASLLEEALVWLPTTDSRLRARVHTFLGRAATVIADSERRIALAAEAVAIARRIDDREALVEALSVHHDANWGPANVEERLAIAEEMARLETGQTIGFGDVYRFADLLELGDIEGSTAAAEGLELASKQTQERGMALWAQVFRTVLELLSGDLEAAEARLMAWFADHRGVSDEMAIQMFGVQFFILRRDQGRCEEVEPPVRALIAENPEIAGWRAGLALLLTELDQRDEVHDLFERLATNDFAELLEAPVTYTLNLALATEACSYLRDAERAQVLYAALLPYAGRNIQVGFGWGAIGAASRYLAMLAVTMDRWDDAEKHFEAALDMNERMGARPWLARTAYEYASMLKSSGGDDDRADELVAQAAALAADVGMPVLAQRVAALRA
jgi:tetratricopeptide (TPR) repeat protein